MPINLAPFAQIQGVNFENIVNLKYKIFFFINNKSLWNIITLDRNEEFAIYLFIKKNHLPNMHIQSYVPLYHKQELKLT